MCFFPHWHPPPAFFKNVCMFAYLLTNINMHPELHLKIISVCPHPHPIHHVGYHLEASKLQLVWWSMTANSESRLAKLSLHLVHHTSNLYKKYRAFSHHFHIFRCCVTIHGHCLGRMNLMVLYWVVSGSAVFKGVSLNRSRRLVQTVVQGNYLFSVMGQELVHTTTTDIKTALSLWATLWVL